MTDTPAHGPDSETPPEGSGKGRRKGRRQHNDPAGAAAQGKDASKATPKRNRKGRKRSRRRKTPRGSAADVEAMVAVVFDRIVLGERRRDILRYVAKAHADKVLTWPTKDGPSPRTIDDYIAKATARLRELSSIDRSDALAAARGRFLLVIRKAHDNGDMPTVRLATRDLARIDGLEPLRVQHSGLVITEHTGTVQHEHKQRPASIEEQASTITELFATAAARRAGNVPPIAAPSNN